MTAPGRVLIVDDNPHDIDLLRIAMEDASLAAEVAIAHDGREAMAELMRTVGDGGAGRPDVIVLDLNMPIMNGNEVLARIQAHEQLRGLAVVVLTTSAAPADRERCLGLGAREYLVKPRRFTEFAPVIARLRTYLEPR